MPEINHKPVTQSVDPNVATPAVPPSDLEKQIEAILAKRRAEVASAAAAEPREPDWSKLTEKDVYNNAVQIPVVEHDIPDYMNIKLKDAEYEVVWASRDQRRLGQLFAEGYEFLKPEHIHPEFKLPLVFNSEQYYEYLDVVALRVHKRILYGKRRRAFELSQRQLKNTNKLPQQRLKNSFELSSNELELDPGLSFYDAKA